jgi:hypothetical protein
LLRVAVIDGQGASIGSAIIKRIRMTFKEEVEVWALGTNAIATSQMLKAGANRGAAGEASICHCVHQVDVVVGSISILVSNAFMGEITPNVAQSITNCRAAKILLPLTQEPITVVGAVAEPLPHQMERLIDRYLVPLVQANKDKNRS